MPLIEAASTIRGTAAQIESDVRRLPLESIHWRPAPKVWSVMDNLCHIVEFVPYWTGEIQAIVLDPSQSWGRDHTHAGRLQAVADTGGEQLENVLLRMRQVVDASAETLASLPDKTLTIEALSRNARWGRKPASFIVDHLLVQHLENHRAQIQRNARQFLESHAVG